MPSKGFNPSLLSSYGNWSESKFNRAQNNLLVIVMYFGLKVIWNGMQIYLQLHSIPLNKILRDVSEKKVSYTNFLLFWSRLETNQR